MSLLLQHSAKRTWLAVIMLTTSLLGGCAFFDSQSSLQDRTLLLAKASDTPLSDKVPLVFTQPHLSLLSLNLAHGRKDRFSQLLLSSETIERNLLDVASYLESSQADIVALQEADSPSNWSGNFNHVEFLGEMKWVQLRFQIINLSIA